MSDIVERLRTAARPWRWGKSWSADTDAMLTEAAAEIERLRSPDPVREALAYLKQFHWNVEYAAAVKTIDAAVDRAFFENERATRLIRALCDRAPESPGCCLWPRCDCGTSLGDGRVG